MAYGDLDYLQTSIHTKAELDADVPQSGSDDYTIRTRLINDWIHEWEDEEGMLWNELFGQASFNNTGATSYSLLSSVSNLKFPGGWVRHVGTASTYYPVKKPEEVALLDDDASRWAYFLGNQYTGFTLYFNTHSSPSGTSGTIQFPYYKKATELSTGTDKLEMSDPYYVIHGVISDLLAKKDPAESDRQFSLAQARLKAMKTANMMTAGWYQENAIVDRTTHLAGWGFGR